MADGSARRIPRAPGPSDKRGAAFDAVIKRALRDGDLDALLAVSRTLARELSHVRPPAPPGSGHSAADDKRVEPKATTIIDQKLYYLTIHVMRLRALINRPEEDTLQRAEHTEREQVAIIVGGSIAGALAAGVLAEHVDRVIVIERDPIPTAPGPRRGVPHAQHFHALLA